MRRGLDVPCPCRAWATSTRQPTRPARPPPTSSAGAPGPGPGRSDGEHSLERGRRHRGGLFQDQWQLVARAAFSKELLWAVAVPYQAAAANEIASSQPLLPHRAGEQPLLPSLWLLDV